MYCSHGLYICGSSARGKRLHVIVAKKNDDGCGGAMMSEVYSGGGGYWSLLDKSHGGCDSLISLLEYTHTMSA